MPEVLRQTIPDLDAAGSLVYDVVLSFEPNTYERVMEYLNSQRGSRPPTPGTDGKNFFYFSNGFLKISRESGKVEMNRIPAFVIGELERITGGKVENVGD